MVIDCLGVHQLVAGRDQIRLNQIIVMAHARRICPITTRRATRAISSYAVVTARIRSECIACADRNRRRLITGRVNSPVNLVSIVVLTVVTGSGHDNYARIHQASHSLAHRIIFIRIYRGHP